MNRVEAANKFILLAEDILEEYKVKYRPIPEQLQAYDDCLQNLKELELNEKKVEVSPENEKFLSGTTGASWIGVHTSYLAGLVLAAYVSY